MNSHKTLFILSLILIAFTSCAQQTNILIVTGGHDFEEKEFFEMFDSFQGLSYNWVIQPKANEIIESGKIESYDAIVFYDMFQKITPNQKQAYLNALEKGTGMVFLHHALVSYQDWPEFQQIIGGKYIEKETSQYPKSTYKHDVNFKVQIVENKEASVVTRNLEDFEIHDEVYGKFIVNNEVAPLLKTDHPESTNVIGWTHTCRNSRIVYLQPGHDHNAYENQNYRVLVRQAIEFVRFN